MNSGGEQTLGTGRFEDEWLPALSRVREGTLLEKMFGIGAGNAFVTSNGERRTYVHNYLIYLILYQGVFGVLTFLILVASLGLRSIRGWWRSGDTCSLAALGALAALYSNSMLFAVHKLLSFNLAILTIYLLVYSVSSANDAAKVHERIYPASK